MKLEELINWIESDERTPNDIFRIHEEFQCLSNEEKEQFRKLGYGDALGMKYISAVEMKKKGTWDSYILEWEKNKHMTGKERLEKYMKENAIENMS